MQGLSKQAVQWEGIYQQCCKILQEAVQWRESQCAVQYGGGVDGEDLWHNDDATMHSDE